MKVRARSPGVGAGIIDLLSSLLFFIADLLILVKLFLLLLSAIPVVMVVMIAVVMTMTITPRG